MPNLGGMSYDLFLGNFLYSSWSMRPALLCDHMGIAYRTHLIDFAAGPVAEQMAPFGLARTVPAMRLPDGTIMGDSLAIIEELASRHPDLPIWPQDPGRRAIARALAAEMHSGFATLRSTCPMNLDIAYTDVPTSQPLQDDLNRIETLWSWAREHAAEGPWLLGDYCAADAMYAPVAARIAGYDLPVSDAARAYVQTHLNDPAFQAWRTKGLAERSRLPHYIQPFPQRSWSDV